MNFDRGVGWRGSFFKFFFPTECYREKSRDGFLGRRAKSKTVGRYITAKCDCFTESILFVTFVCPLPSVINRRFRAYSPQSRYD